LSVHFCSSPSAPLALPPSPTRRSSALAPPLARLHVHPDERRARRLALLSGLSARPSQLRSAHHRDRPRPHPDEPPTHFGAEPGRSEEHTSELQSRENLVCRLLLEKKKE